MTERRMDSEEREKTPRRSFLRAAARGAGLAALSGLAWATALRSGTAGARQESTRSRCGRCPVLPVCARPDGLQARDSFGLQQDLEKLGRISGAERLCEGTPEESSPARIGS